MDEFKARAEHEMQEAGKEIMEKALAEHKAALYVKWNEVKESLYTGDSEDARWINSIIEDMRTKYELPRPKKV